MKKAETKELATIPSYGEDSGSGFEGTTSRDLSIPFLRILESKSPEVEGGELEGAKAGMLLNTVTRELLTKAVVIPVRKDISWIEWIPRAAGGGFVAVHAPDSPVVVAATASGQRTGKFLLENGNELVETHMIYCLLLDEAGAEVNGFAVLSATSMRIKPCRDWFTSMYQLKGRPPLFANRAVISTKFQKYAKGNFYNLQVAPLRATWAASLIDPATESSLLVAAKDFREMIASGKAKADFQAGSEDHEPTEAKDGELY